MSVKAKGDKVERPPHPYFGDGAAYNPPMDEKESDVCVRCAASGKVKGLSVPRNSADAGPTVIDAECPDCNGAGRVGKTLPYPEGRRTEVVSDEPKRVLVR